MYMFSENRKTVADYKTFKVVTNATFDKDKKIALTGYTEGFGAECDVLAFFTDEKTAMEELERIFAAIAAGQTTYAIGK